MDVDFPVGEPEMKKQKNSDGELGVDDVEYAIRDGLLVMECCSA